MSQRLQFGALLVLAWLFRTLPLSLSHKLANAVGRLASDVVKLRRDVALDNLRRAFPEKNNAECLRTYRACWRHFARVGAELSRLPRIDTAFLQRWFDYSESAVLRQALEGGRGCIVVSGHFGNWEWMGGAMAQAGIPMTYVVTGQTNTLVEEWMNGLRRSVGIEIVHRRDAAKGVLSALKRNRAVAILCDQDAGDAGIFVPFFGRPASTPRGPALFHMRTGAPIIFGYGSWEQDRKFHAHFEALEFQTSTGGRAADERAITAAISSRLEAEVRKQPEKWLWLHRRWKSVPPDLVTAK